MRRMTNFWAFIKKLAGLIGFTGDKIEIGNDLEVDGKLKAFENITDANDRSRFIEGNIETPTISGVTFKYSKWALSGSHLMIVIAGDITANTQISLTAITINVPQWIKDKLVALNGNYIDANNDSRIVSSSWERVGTIKHNLQKSDSTTIRVNIACLTSNIPTENGSFRISYDAIIDNAN